MTKNQSYGLAIFARDTGRCAVVMRRYSFAYYDFLRGFYRPTYLSGLLRSLTAPELEAVRKMAAPPGLNLALLEEQGRKYIYQYGEFERSQAAIMLGLARKDILEFCDPGVGPALRGGNNPVVQRTTVPPQGGNLAEEWTLPKGHLNDMETHVGCAIRECREELGVAVSESMVELSHHVESHASLTNGVVYTCNYWPVLVDRECAFPPISEPSEVCGRAWMSLGDLESRMRSYNFAAVKAMARQLGL